MPNTSADQARLIRLLATVGVRLGGKREDWARRPPAGDDGTCPPLLAQAIGDFQSFWAKRGRLQASGTVMDPDSAALAHLGRLADEAPGKFRLLLGGDAILKAYPRLRDLIAGAPGTIPSALIELTNFDVGGDDLKPEHRNGLFAANAKAFSREFQLIKAYGFHSNTGGPGFDNLRLAESRGAKAIDFVRSLGIVDARVRTWKYQGVAWQKGMEDGEAPSMRKVAVLLSAASPFGPADKAYPGMTRTKNF